MAQITPPTGGATYTITLDAPQTVGQLVLSSGGTSGGYTIADSGSNTLTFSNTTAGAPARSR